MSKQPYKTIDQCVGGTPLVRLQRLNPNPSNIILGKLEGNNPAGSVKDRAALNMISKAEKRGEIHPGDTLIEATSGNTGIALAMVAAIIKLNHLDLPDPSEIFTQVAATSIGICDEQVLVDLCYEEDSVADADFNIVMASDGKIVEIQGAAEGNRYSIESVHEVLDAARGALPVLFREQQSAISMIDSLEN